MLSKDMLRRYSVYETGEGDPNKKMAAASKVEKKLYCTLKE